jgi:cytochrome bd ubiquinol oxidase subunit II
VTLPDLAAALVVLALSAYLVLGGADFGAGFWDLTAGGPERGARVRGIVKFGMSPVWEANHVWLIFVFVAFWTAFPVAFGSIASTLYVPLFAAAVGIIFRGAAFALRGEAATIAEARILGAAFALSSVLVPFFLGAAVGGIASGRVPVGNASGDALTSWWNPTSVVVGVLTVAVGAHLSAVFLAADSIRAEQPDMVRAFRARALGSGAVAGTLAVAALFVVRDDAHGLYHGLVRGGGLALVCVSAVAGLVTLGLEWRSRFDLARYTAAVAAASIVAGWAVAQRPYLLPPELTLSQAAASDATLVALLVSAAVGMVLLVPSLWYLFRLVLRGKLDTRFRPLTAGERRERR